MAVAMMAELVSVEGGNRRYRVFTGLDRATAEIAVLDVANPQQSYTEGVGVLTSRSGHMIGKIVRKYRETGQWPDKIAVQA